MKRLQNLVETHYSRHGRHQEHSEYVRKAFEDLTKTCVALLPSGIPCPACNGSGVVNP